MTLNLNPNTDEKSVTPVWRSKIFTATLKTATALLILGSVTSCNGEKKQESAGTFTDQTETNDKDNNSEKEALTVDIKDLKRLPPQLISSIEATLSSGAGTSLQRANLRVLLGDVRKFNDKITVLDDKVEKSAAQALFEEYNELTERLAALPLTDVKGLLPSGKFSVNTNGNAPTPPMGFNPWNAFRTEVDEEKLDAVAQKLVTSGLLAKGYNRMNLDDGWWLKRDQETGKLVIRSEIFPSAAPENNGGVTSFKPFTKKMHDLGFKVGIYTEIAKNACAQAWDPDSPNLPEGTQAEREVGLYGHLESDLRQFFIDWNFDYVKADACGLADFGPNAGPVQQGRYAAFGPYVVRGNPERSRVDDVKEMFADLSATLNKIKPDNNYVLSVVVWGEAAVNHWAKEFGNLWRTSADIHSGMSSFYSNFNSSAGRELYAGPNRWNDPDMMALGLWQFDNVTRARTHMSLWASLAAPLILGYDMTRTDRENIIEIAGNEDVIAVNQDPLGNQGTIFQRDNVDWVVKRLKSDDNSGRVRKSLAIHNRDTNTSRTVNLDWRELKLKTDSTASFKDLWSKNVETLRHGAPIVVGPQETRHFLIEGDGEIEGGFYLSEMPAIVNVGTDGFLGNYSSANYTQIAARTDFTSTGAVLRTNGTRQYNAITALANTRLEVKLDGKFSRFETKAAVEDHQSNNSLSVKFRVYGDKKLLYVSPTMSRSSPAEIIDLDVKDVKVLELVADGLTPAANLRTLAWVDPILRY